MQLHQDMLTVIIRLNRGRKTYTANSNQYNTSKS